MSELPTPQMQDVPGAFPASLASSRAQSQMSTRSDVTIRADDRPQTPVQTILDKEIENTEQTETPKQHHHDGAAAVAAAAVPVAATNVIHNDNSTHQPTESQPASSSAVNQFYGAEQSNTNATNTSAVPAESKHMAAPAESKHMAAPAAAATTTAAAVSEVDNKQSVSKEKAPLHPTEEVDTSEEVEHVDQDGNLQPIATTKSNNPMQRTKSTEDDLFRALSRRRTSNYATRQQTQHDDEEQAEIERLLSRMFGKTRQAASEEERTRHVGVVWKHLTVKGLGLGSALQPSTGDLFMGLPRAIRGLFKGKRANKKPIKTIIDDFSGCIKPGEMCLVLGRPGSGCSTFLKVLGNQRYGYEKVEGDVTYGGTDAHTMAKKYRGEVLYNPEDDLHYATLKVRTTLEFALQTKAPGKESRKEGETKKEYISEFLRVVSKLFWIEHTLDTKVGNSLIRGVSGGEKKRVSIAEAMITRASTQCWDNSTKGLDASTALEYVSSLRALTNMTHISTAVALYQAGESLYELFDKVMLIHEGECCYYGPADKAADYFTKLGFVKPDRWTTADFLTSVTDEHERKIKDGWHDRIPRSARQFGEAFAESQIAKDNNTEIEEFEGENRKLAEERRANQSKETATKNYSVSFPQQVWACTKRQWLVMLGDKQSLVGKWGGILFQALIVGSLFYDLPNTSAGAFTRGGVLFFVLLFNALLSLAELNSAFESRPIMLKHKSFSFYRPAAFAIAQTVIDIPAVFIQNVIFTVVVYFMTNLSRTPSQFFIALVTIFALTMTMYAFFRSLGATFGSLDAATRITGLSLQVMIVYTGYLIPPRKMHPWFSWLRWINPVQYGFEMLMANEFTGLELQCQSPYLVPQGNGATTQYQSCALQGSEPGSAIVNGANYIDTAYGYRRSHLWRNFGIIWAFFLFFTALTAVGFEMQKPNKGGGAVTIYKRGQAPKEVEKAVEGRKNAADIENGKDKDIGDGSSDSEEEKDQKIEGIARNDTVFTFQKVNYRIPYKGGERQLLENVQGFVRPGKLTALMGASGAGKTTLLNTLAQRITFGVVSGDFLVDGKPLPKSFQRSSGFAEQQDIHEEFSTVREALQFSAKLRQPKEVPLKEKYDYVEKIIDLLEMRPIAGAAIGEIGNGLNAEQRKRLTIGVELASKPELLLFLDEPTSGLDSGAAFNVVRFLRKLADAGQAILCTIHQPSSVLFEHFDTLLLLQSGGKTVFFGDLGKDSRNLIDYLESNGAMKCPPNANPAEYMLEAIGAGNPDYKGKDFSEVWAKSKQCSSLTNEIQDLIGDRRESTKDDAVKDDREYAMPLATQVLTVVHRSFVSIWRNQSYVIGIFALHILTGLFNSFTFWKLGNSYIDMQSRLFSVFMTLTICPPLIQQLQPRFLGARNLYKSREANSKIYSWIAFVCGTIVSEIPYRIVAGTVYWACWYYPTFFPRDSKTSASMWAMVIVFELFYLGFGQAIAALSPNELLASLLVPIFFTFIVSFCGVVVPYPALIPFWRSWMYWATPFKYLLESMLSLLVHNQPIRCEELELAIFNAPPGQSCDSYAGQYANRSGGYVETMQNGMCGICQYRDGDAFAAGFNVFYKFVWRDFGIFWIYIIFQFFLVFVCSYLYLRGGSGIMSALRGTKRKEKKLRAEKNAPSDITDSEQQSHGDEKV